MVRLRTKLLVVLLGAALIFSLAVAGGITAILSLSDIGLSGGDTLVVSVENHDEGRNIAPVVREATAYWNNNNGQYPAAYDAQFEFREDASDPDILIRYDSSVSCERADSSGCAPTVSSKRDVERSSKPLVVKISASQNKNRLMTKRALVHELGHILSISHCEEPRLRMGCPQSTEPTGPAYDERRYPFNTTKLRVYVDADGASNSTQAAVDRVLSDAPAGEMETLPSDITYQRVSNQWRSHITIRVNECSDCQPDVGGELSGIPPYSSIAQAASYAEITITVEDADDVETWLPPILESYSGNESKPRQPTP